MEYYEHNVDNLAIEIVRSEVISLFWEDWEVGWHKLPLVNGPFVPRNEGCVKGELESLDSHRSLCSECQRSSLVELSQQQRIFSPWTGSDNKKHHLVRDMQEKERERRALLSCAGWIVSFEHFLCCTWCAVERGCSFLSLVRPCGFESLRKLKLGDVITTIQPSTSTRKPWSTRTQTKLSRQLRSSDTECPEDRDDDTGRRSRTKRRIM